MKANKKAGAVAASIVAMCLSAQSASAGSMCEPAKPNPGRTAAALTMAINVQEHLEAHQPAAALLARVGDDVSDRGLKYTHAGVVVRDHGEGRWTVVHELNHCGRSESNIFNEGLGTFLLDSPYMLDVLVIIPSETVQRRLAGLATSDAATRLHEPSYNMLAHPFSTRFQNSNGWLAEMMASTFLSGREPVTRKRSQRFMAKTGYRPTEVRIGQLEQLGASMFRANVRFDDHPVADRVDGRFNIATVESVRDWVVRIDTRAKVTELVAPDNIRFPRTAFPDPVRTRDDRRKEP